MSAYHSFFDNLNEEFFKLDMVAMGGLEPPTSAL